MQSSKQHNALLNPFIGLGPIDNIELVRHFDNADSLVNAFLFNHEVKHAINSLPSYNNGSLRVLQSALACKMVGLDSSANHLLKKFIEIQLIDSNEGYQLLLAEVIKRKAVKESSSKGGHSGRSNRYKERVRLKSMQFSCFLSQNVLLLIMLRKLSHLNC